MRTQEGGLRIARAAALTVIWIAAIVLAIAVELPAILPWVVVAICLSVWVSGRTRTVRTSALGELDLFLERCRRRGEPTSFLVVDIPAHAKALPTLLQSVRVTDSLDVRRAGSRYEVYGLLEGSDISRAQLEARFTQALDGVAPTFGWASYPDDGLTVDALHRQARGSMTTTRTESARSHGRTFVRPSRRQRAIELTLDPSTNGAQS